MCACLARRCRSTARLDPGGDVSVPRLLRVDVVALAVVGVIVFVLAFVAPRAFEVPVRLSQTDAIRGTVLRVFDERVDTTSSPPTTTRALEVEIEGRTVTIEETVAQDDAQLVPPKPGDRVLVQELERPGGSQYFIVDHVRSGLLLILAFAFAALVLLVGRWYGVRSLLGLAATYLILMRFILPAILSGYSPLAVSLVGGIGIMASTLVLAHGADRKSGAAVGGTALALVLIVVFADLSITAAKFTGLAEEDAATVFHLFGGSIDARGLLLSGILIGALGALDDVTMTQSSTVFELRAANPDLRALDLYSRGMRVGRDHIASIVNTLVLAYAGASLPLLVILASQTEQVGTLVNREFLATEVVRTVVGSIGLVAAVPLTTALAAWSAGLPRPGRDRRDRDDPGDGEPPLPYAAIETLDEFDLLGPLRSRRPQI